MHKRWRVVIAGLSVFAAVNVPVHAADTSDTGFSARVRLAVAAPAAIKNTLTSQLERQLRSLNGVELVDSMPDFEINVVAMEVRSTRGYRGGIAISTLVLARFQYESMERLFRPAETARGLAQVSNLWEHPSHSLQMDASDRLQLMCKQIIADFDTRHLEKSRKRLRQEPNAR